METFTKTPTLKTFVFIFLLFSGNLFAENVIARVTYYWGCKNTSTGNKPVSGKTIAVDPKIIPYGSKIFIPKMDKTFVAHDTGGAVKSRLASRKHGRNNIVVDIFCSSKAEAQKYIRKYPMFMPIKIIKK
jgi:3D (Asp-Asp-Asp) domain-containing protein